jgi:hypothetical protein
MHFGTYIVIWSCLAAIVLALALLRYIVSLHEDDNIHISASADSLIAKQMAVYKTLEGIDRWGKALTVVAVVAGLAIGVLYMIQTYPRV